MERKQIFDLVISCLTKINSADISSISEKTDLLKEGIVDSLDGMSLIFELEQHTVAKLELDNDIEGLPLSGLIDLIQQAQLK